MPRMRSTTYATISTTMTMAAYLMNVAATSEPPPELRGAGSLVSSNSSKSLLRPMLLLTLGLSCLASLSLQQGNVSTKSNGPGLRMACGGPGGVGCSVGRRKGGWLWMTETPRDSTVIRTSTEKKDKPWQDTAWR